MLNLSLKGSQISLSRQSQSSARKSARSKNLVDNKNHVDNEELHRAYERENTRLTEIDLEDQMAAEMQIKHSNVKQWLDAYVKNEAVVPDIPKIQEKRRSNIKQMTQRREPKKATKKKVPIRTPPTGRSSKATSSHRGDSGQIRFTKSSRVEIAEEHLALGPPPAYSLRRNNGTSHVTVFTKNEPQARADGANMDNHVRQTQAALLIQTYWREHRKRLQQAQKLLKRSLVKKADHYPERSVDPKNARDEEGFCAKSETESEDINLDSVNEELPGGDVQVVDLKTQSHHTIEELLEKADISDDSQEPVQESVRSELWKSERPKNWSDMLEEIDRVLQGADGGIDPLTPQDHWSLPHTESDSFEPQDPLCCTEKPEIKENMDPTQNDNASLTDLWPVTETYASVRRSVELSSNQGPSDSNENKMPRQMNVANRNSTETAGDRTTITTSSSLHRKPIRTKFSSPDKPQSSVGEYANSQELALELEERTNAISRLQRILEHQRELFTKQLKETQKEAAERLKSAKVDYEATLARNYNLIDELIEEKKLLHSKCEALVLEMKALTKRTEDKLKLAESNHQINLRKAEAKIIAAEKLKREKWEAEKARQIKDLTARGLEGELSKMLESHKAELQQLKHDCDARIQAADTMAFEKYQRQVETLKETWRQEKEEACASERDIFNTRLEQALRDERAVLEKQRERLLQEISDERERLILMNNREREEFEKVRRTLEDTYNNAKEMHLSELARLQSELESRHKNEIENMEKKNALNRAASVERIRTALKEEFSSRENELREQLRKERDKQLEEAVRRLEEETTAVREELEKEQANRIKRVKEKLEEEIKQLEESEKQAMQKYNESKTNLIQVEHEKEKLVLQLQKRTEELEESHALCKKLSDERQNLSDVIKKEFEERLVNMEKETLTLKSQLAEAKTRLSMEQSKHQAELQDVKDASAFELETLHQKIKSAMKRKDLKMARMRETFQLALSEHKTEVEVATRRADHLEELLDEQRRQLLQQS